MPLETLQSIDLEADLSDGLNEQIHDEIISKNVVNRKNNDKTKNPFIQS